MQTEFKETLPGPVNIDNLIGGLDGQYIQDRLDTIYQRQATLTDIVRLNELVDLHGDFTKRVCFKTGVVLQELDTFAIMRFFDICPDTEYGIRLLKRQAIANPILHWTYTDGESLDKLMDIDPLGYFVYASAYIVDNHSPTSPEILRHRILLHSEYENEYGDISYRTIPNDEKDRIKKDAEFDWVMQKAKLREQLDKYPLAQIVRINEIMRRYLSFFEASAIPDKLDTYDMLMDDLNPEILPAIGKDIDSFELYLTSTIKQIIRMELKAGRIKDPSDIDYSTALKIKQRYNGLSNFFAQYQPVPIRDEDTIGNKRAIILDGFVKLADIPSNQLARQERIEKELRANKLIPMNKNCTLAKPQVKAAKFSFGKKSEDIEL